MVSLIGSENVGGSPQGELTCASVFLGRENGLVMLVTAQHDLHITFCSGKTNLPDEGGAVRRGAALLPFENVAAAGVVIGQGVGQGIVGVGISFDELLQIPRADERVGGGVQKILRREWRKTLGVGPIPAGRVEQHLHQTDFALAAAGLGVEPAFAPDDGFHERGRDAVTPRGGQDGRVLAVVAQFQPPTINAHPAQQEQERQNEVTPFHGLFVRQEEGF